jgi:hypothetical protein
MGDFHKIVVIIGTAIIFVAFLLALKIREDGKAFPYLKHFYILPLLLLLVSFNTIVIDLTNRELMAFLPIVEKILSTLDFIFYSYFFSIIVGSSDLKKTIKWISLFFIILTIPLVVILSEKSLFHYYFRAFHNMGKLLFCLVYLYSIFNSSPKLVLKNEPAFWITMGVLFYTSITIPIFLCYYFLATNKFRDLLNILFPLTNISIIIMHLFFIKGLLCTFRQHKTLSSSL